MWSGLKRCWFGVRLLVWRLGVNDPLWGVMVDFLLGGIEKIPKETITIHKQKI